MEIVSLQTEKRSQYGVLTEEEQKKVELNPSASIVSAMMAQQVAMGRNEASLFGNDMLTAIAAAQSEDLANFKIGKRGRTQDRNGKPFALTNFRFRLVLHLSHFITMQIEAPDIKRYLDMLEDDKQPDILIVRPIVIDALAKEVYHGTARTRNKAHLLRELAELCETKQVQNYEVGKKGKIYSASILNLIEVGGTTTRKDFYNMTDEELAGIDFVKIAFGKLFFFELRNRYAYIPKKLLDLWGVKGNGTETELFAMLLAYLLSIYWQAYSTAKNKSREAKHQAKDEAKNRAEKREAIQTAKARSLQKTISFADINDILASPYKPNKRTNLLADIERAFAIYKDIDLVEDFTIDRKANEVKYTFSMTYGKEVEQQTKDSSIEIEANSGNLG